MLDLRSKADSKENAHVPQELFDKWFEFYGNYHLNKDYNDSPWFVKNIDQDYWIMLNKAKKLNKPLVLRVMLSTQYSPELAEWQRQYAYPAWDKLFAKFMRQEGYDGLIYIEGGDNSYTQKSPISYTFFNLDKIGDYETWHQIPRTVPKKEPRPKPELPPALTELFKKP